jgi:hypothetical protein
MSKVSAGSSKQEAPSFRVGRKSHNDSDKSRKTGNKKKPVISLLPETLASWSPHGDAGRRPQLNRCLDLQRYKIAFICGRSSSRLDLNIIERDVRRAFTAFRLMIILEENHHSFLIVGHEPLLQEDAVLPGNTQKH